MWLPSTLKWTRGDRTSTAYLSDASCTSPSARGRALWSACLLHALHDGYTDTIYVLLPVWQTDLALGYGVLALLRGIYAGSMAALQVPAGRLAERVDGRIVLALGTALVGAGYGLAGCSGGVIGLCAALAISGAGSSTQHPIASATVSRAYGTASRTPLGIYNFAGDLGKAAIPALTSLLLALTPWRTSLWLLALPAVAMAVGIALIMPSATPAPRSTRSRAQAGNGRGGFSLLFTIGLLDSGVRMGLLTFLPFLLQAKGASLTTIGLGFSLVFMGGAAGKFTCGWLGAHIGVLRTVVLTEGGTTLGIFAVLFLPLLPCVLMLPLLGVMLNGTSSVLYGTVPELTPPHHRTERAFALFYTGTIGSGAISPVLYGMLGDVVGVNWAAAATALVALMILPFAFALAPRLHR